MLCFTAAAVGTCVPGSVQEDGVVSVDGDQLIFYFCPPPSLNERKGGLWNGLRSSVSPFVRPVLYSLLLLRYTSKTLHGSQTSKYPEPFFI